VGSSNGVVMHTGNVGRGTTLCNMSRAGADGVSCSPPPRPLSLLQSATTRAICS
jgi:hypothetical protein